MLYAFEHAQPGDLFVQKAPAATIQTLASALQQIFHTDTRFETIGTRHGEKAFETLLTREEMARAVDMGEYYRIPADTRDLNYDIYFTQGQEVVAQLTDYNSHNTHILNEREMMDMLLRLDYVQRELAAWNPDKVLVQ